MTRTDLDPVIGRAIFADGVGTAVASAVGGSPTTTYAENIGVMAATRIYSTAAYYVAAVVAILFGLCPKFGALVAATPGGVLGGITVVLYGMIGLLGAKIWIENGSTSPTRSTWCRSAPGSSWRSGRSRTTSATTSRSAGSRSARSSCWPAGTCCACSPPPTCKDTERPVGEGEPTRRRRERRPDVRHRRRDSEVKPPPFPYHRPETLDEALRVLAEVGDDGKVLAGGQSLVPLLNMRLAAPAHLVDINRLAELDVVDTDADGVRVGALARHADVEHDAAASGCRRCCGRRCGWSRTRRSATAARRSAASRTPTRPARCRPCWRCSTARWTLARRGGRRTVPAADFFVGPLESAVEPGELAVVGALPGAAAGHRHRVRRGRPPARRLRGLRGRRGGHARRGPAGRARPGRRASRSVRLPVVVDLTDAVAGSDRGRRGLGGGRADGGRAACEPDVDIHATAGYRRHLVAGADRAGAAAARRR